MNRPVNLREVAWVPQQVNGLMTDLCGSAGKYGSRGRGGLRSPGGPGDTWEPDGPRTWPAARNHPDRARRHRRADHRAHRRPPGHSSLLRPGHTAPVHDPAPGLSSANSRDRSGLRGRHTPPSGSRTRSRTSARGSAGYVCSPTAPLGNAGRRGEAENLSRQGNLQPRRGNLQRGDTARWGARLARLVRVPVGPVKTLPCKSCRSEPS
jgi:hypothetical protein